MRICLDMYDYSKADLNHLSLTLLKLIAKQLEIPNYRYCNKNRLVDFVENALNKNHKKLFMLDEDLVMFSIERYDKEASIMLKKDQSSIEGLTVQQEEVVIPQKPRRGRPPKNRNIENAVVAKKEIEERNILSDSIVEYESTVPLNSIDDFSSDIKLEAQLQAQIDFKNCVESDARLNAMAKNDAAGILQTADNRPQMPPRRNFLNCGDVAMANQLIRSGELNEYKGILEINIKGYGFIRGSFRGNNVDLDAFVDNMIIRQLNLRDGDYLIGAGKRSDEGKSGSVSYIMSVNGIDTDKLPRRKTFEQLTPIFPDERLKLESPVGRSDIAIRCIDMIAPIGKGQRALIVSPPKAGKTTLLKQIANSIVNNNPEVKLFMLLIDERPEEVTDMQRSIKADVVYSTFDETAEHHIQTAEAVLRSAKRYVECGNDVVIMLDSITRLARAYNMTIEHSGRALSGGLDPMALSAPKRFFGSARNMEHGGSLTIIATALIDTGSRLDDVIFEEFKGTGNMEVVLDRRLSERRIFPAIDLAKSSTRREDLLLSQEEMLASRNMRAMLDTSNADTLDSLINEIYGSKNNAEFIKKFNAKIEMVQRKGYVMRK